MGKRGRSKRGGGGYEYDDDDEFAVPLPSKVGDGLWLGGSRCLQDPTALQRIGITHIVNSAAGSLESVAWKGIDVMEFPLEDTAELSAMNAMTSALPRASAYVHAALAGGGGVLVHCLAGVSRSATIVVGYLMEAQGLTLREAFERVVIARPEVLPNPGFMKALVGWEEALWRRKLGAAAAVGGGAQGGFTPTLDITDYAVRMLQHGSPVCATIKPKLLRVLVEKSKGNLAVAKEWAEQGQHRLLDDDSESDDGGGGDDGSGSEDEGAGEGAGGAKP